MSEESEHSEVGLRVVRELDAWSLADQAPLISMDDCKAFIAGHWLLVVGGDIEYAGGLAPIAQAAELVKWDFSDPLGDKVELARLLTVFAERWGSTR